MSCFLDMTNDTVFSKKLPDLRYDTGIFASLHYVDNEIIGAGKDLDGNAAAQRQIKAGRNIGDIPVKAGPVHTSRIADFDGIVSDPVQKDPAHVLLLPGSAIRDSSNAASG